MIHAPKLNTGTKGPLDPLTLTQVLSCKLFSMPKIFVTDMLFPDVLYYTGVITGIYGAGIRGNLPNLLMSAIDVTRLNPHRLHEYFKLQD